jgi:AraC family transcriptional regulator, transcriptional activator of pobA
MQKIPTYSFFNTGRPEKIVDTFIWSSHNPYLSDRQHCHDYHELIFFYKGGGKHDINFQAHSIKSLSFHVVPKTILHQINRNAHSQGFTTAITEIFVEQLAKFYPTHNYSLLFEREHVIQPTASQFKGFEFYLTEIQSKETSNAMLQNLCAAILLKLLPFVDSGQDKTGPVSSEIRNLLQENFMKRLSAQQYADMLNTSIANLNLKLKKSSGKTIMQLQNDLLISKIKQHIYSTDFEFKEIAHQFGFDDYAHFSKFFKKQSGYAPSDYRTMIKKSIR